jgi:hypothetical protein
VATPVERRSFDHWTKNNNNNYYYYIKKNNDDNLKKKKKNKTKQNKINSGRFCPNHLELLLDSLGKTIWNS